MNDERGTMKGGKAGMFPDDDDQVFFDRLLAEWAGKADNER